jgi:hypothetical protein
MSTKNPKDALLLHQLEYVSYLLRQEQATDMTWPYGI